MSEGSFTESVVEEAPLAWLESLGYAVKRAGDSARRAVRRTSGITDRYSWGIKGERLFHPF